MKTDMQDNDPFRMMCNIPRKPVSDDLRCYCYDCMDLVPHAETRHLGDGTHVCVPCWEWREEHDES